MNIRKATQFERINYACQVIRILTKGPHFDKAPVLRMILDSCICIMTAPPNVREAAYNAMVKAVPTLATLAEVDKATPSARNNETKKA